MFDPFGRASLGCSCRLLAPDGILAVPGAASAVPRRCHHPARLVEGGQARPCHRPGPAIGQSVARAKAVGRLACVWQDCPTAVSRAKHDHARKEHRRCPRDSPACWTLSWASCIGRSMALSKCQVLQDKPSDNGVRASSSRLRKSPSAPSSSMRGMQTWTSPSMKERATSRKASKRARGFQSHTLTLVTVLRGGFHN